MFGRCDYWILDDDWGGWQQTIHIYNMSLLTPSSVAELQSLLRQRYRQWHIWICLDGKRILRRSPKDKGIMVYPDRTEFYCDIDRLKRIFGGRMRWSTPWRG